MIKPLSGYAKSGRGANLKETEGVCPRVMNSKLDWLKYEMKSATYYPQKRDVQKVYSNPLNHGFSYISTAAQAAIED